MANSRLLARRGHGPKKVFRRAEEMAVKRRPRGVRDVFSVAHFARPSARQQLARPVRRGAVRSRIEGDLLQTLLPLAVFAWFVAEKDKSPRPCFHGVLRRRVGRPVVAADGKARLPPTAVLTCRPRYAIVAAQGWTGDGILTGT